ncbi:hypothetical protein B2G71_01105 [Novosphingobium sp. PC22D]|uniref:glycosyltransferase n=1 Tax=Novosphingobium sp. PC22D TaxID=1962403 RepID=UPI000BEFA37F|nr:glycosyltransferase [Novosphingobium sp. PC22D]PEQ14236.1 hypothetical protein B2G71_01105 [Novosphingobium sp. PC22D]
MPEAKRPRAPERWQRPRRLGLFLGAGLDHSRAGRDGAGMLAHFESLDCEGHVFTDGSDGPEKSRTWHHADAPLLLSRSDDLAVLHFDRRTSPAALSAFRRLNCIKLVRYHGVVPPDRLGMFSLKASRAAGHARRTLRILAEIDVALFLCAAPEQVRDLVEIGIDAREIATVPCFHQFDALSAAAPDPGARISLDRGAMNVLAVGTVEPSKNYEALIRAFSRLVDKARVPLALNIIGRHPPEHSDYLGRLLGLAGELGHAERIFFHPRLSTEALATVFRECDLFWSMRTYETQSSSLIESMGFGLPALAGAARVEARMPGTASPDRGTGPAGSNPVNAARAAAAILLDEQARREAARAVRTRFRAEFSTTAIAAKLADALADAGIGPARAPDEKAEESRAGRPPAALESDACACSGCTAEAVEWLDLPDLPELIHAARDRCATARARVRWPLDAQRDLLNWAARRGVSESAEIAAYFARFDVRRAMARLTVPAEAGHLDGAMRLLWTVDRDAGAFYDLTTHASVAAYLAWFERQGIALTRAGDTGGNR